MTQNVQIRWKDDLDPQAFNSFVGKAVGFDGIRSGFEVEIGTQPDRASIRAGVLVTRKGETIEEDAELVDYFSAAQGRAIPANAEATARHDLIVCEFQYAQSYPNKPVATYHILEGTAGELDFEDLPRFHQFRTPIAVARIPAGGTGYDLIAVWPRTHRVNYAYDHVTGEWKVVNGDSLVVRAMVVTQDFADLFGWTAGLRIDMIAAGEKADGDVIVESDWSNVIDLGPNGWEPFNDLLAEVVAARGSRDLLGDRLSQSMEANGDLLAAAVFRQWILDFVDSCVKTGMRVHEKSGDATKIEIEPGVWVSRMGLRVENESVVELAVPDNTASAYPRWDIVVGRSLWTQPGQPSAATYHIIQGTPDAAPAFPSRTANDVVLAYCLIEDGATTYSTILIANQFKHHNCYTDVDHTIHIVDGSLPAWVMEYQPNTSIPLGLAPHFKVFMHPGGVADDADITSGMVEAVKLTQDGIGELVAARGDFSTLAGRLNVSLNANGTLKANTVGASQIVDASVGVAEISSAIAGDGLSGGSGSALSVNVDDDGIEINADTLRLKTAGVKPAKLSAECAGPGLQGGGGLLPLAVLTDGETTNIDGDGAVAVIGLPNNSAYPQHRIYPVVARYHGAGHLIENGNTENVKFATTDFERLGGVGDIPTYAVVDNSGSYTEFQNKDAGIVILEPSAIWRVTIHIDLNGLTWTGAPATFLVYLKHTESDGTPIATYRLGSWQNGGGSGINDLIISASTLLEMAENDKLYFEIVNVSGNNYTVSSNDWVEFELLK